MPPLAIAGAISGGTSLISGLMGSSAASKAAAAQAAAAQAAAANDKQQQAAAIAAQTNATQTQTANAQPYTSAGSTAINHVSDLLKPGGQLTQGFQAFDPNSVNPNTDPGFQFQEQQGQLALQNSAAARGGLLSTGTAKNLLGFSQGLASTEYGNAYNRALESYQANQNNYNTNNNNVYSRLMGVSDLGQNSTTNLNANLQQGAQNQGNIDMTSAQLVGQQLTNAGAARASGIVGSSNALTSGISGLGNSIASTLMLPRPGSNVQTGGSYNWATPGSEDYGQPG